MQCPTKNKKARLGLLNRAFVLCGAIKNAGGIGYDLFNDGNNITNVALFIKSVNLL